MAKIIIVTILVLAAIAFGATLDNKVDVAGKFRSPFNNVIDCITQTII